jgi:hypothetical protein
LKFNAGQNRSQAFKSQSAVQGAVAVRVPMPVA